jgi:hypothetical protein
VTAQAALGSADQIPHGRRRVGPQLFEDFLGGNSPVHNPDPLGRPVAGADGLDHAAQRGLVGGVAGKHLVRQGQSLGCDHQGHDPLDAVAAAAAQMLEEILLVRQQEIQTAV